MGPGGGSRCWGPLVWGSRRWQVQACPTPANLCPATPGPGVLIPLAPPSWVSSPHFGVLRGAPKGSGIGILPQCARGGVVAGWGQWDLCWASRCGAIRGCHLRVPLPALPGTRARPFPFGCGGIPQGAGGARAFEAPAAFIPFRPSPSKHGEIGICCLPPLNKPICVGVGTARPLACPASCESFPF